MGPKKSIALVVIIVIISITVTILSAMGIVGYSLFSSHERSQLHALNLVMVEQARTGLAIPLWNYDKTQMLQAAESVMKVDSVYAVVVRKPDSEEIIMALVRGPQWKIVQTDKEITSDGLLSQTQNIMHANELIGKVQLSVTPRFMEERLAGIRITIFVGIAVVASLLSMTLYSLLWSMVIKPIKLLEQYALGINSGSVDDPRINATYFYGELDSLRNSTFKAIKLLDARYAELQLYREHLEEEVNERTSELRLARDAADNANKTKSMFLANMSHEIRTPMNAVLGFAQLLTRDSSLSPSAHAKVATIMKSGDHLLAIINDILEMSRIEAGRVDVRTEPVDLHALLDDLTVMFRMRAEQKGLTFVSESAADVPRLIMADLGKLRQILINLLGNAVKYTKEGSFSMRAYSAGIDRIAIEVQDSGIGITSEEQEKLFRPFERTRSGEQTAGGTGLGLAISREYAHLIGGEITVASREGEGSCFRLEFHAPISDIMPVSTKSPHRVMRLSPDQGEIRILVVDDHKINRDLLREILQPLGFIVDEAVDGSEAVDKAISLKPRIILMDQVMPGTGGIEATRILRRTFTGESLTIIGITASTFEEEKKLFLEAGLDYCIGKPFREQELYDLLSQHAGVVFDLEENEESLPEAANADIPTLAGMSAEWRDHFMQALARKNITRIRKLGEEAKEFDPQLSGWILERAALYDLNGLKKLAEAG